MGFVPLALASRSRLSILDHGRLVGRLDSSLDRRARRLTVRAVHLELGVRPTEPLAGRVAWALRDVAAFVGADEAAVLATEPTAFGAMVTAALR